MPISVDVILSLLIAFASIGIGGALALVAGADPLTAFWSILYGGFGSIHGISETLVSATPLLVAGLGIVFAYRCKVFNVGTEGQLQIGALAAAMVGIDVGVPYALHLPLTFLAAFIAGAFWALIPAILKVQRDVNEVLSTLLMNYVAIYMLTYMVHWPLRDPTKMYARTADLLPSAQLPSLIGRLHAGFLMALLFTLLVYIVFQKTTLGRSIMMVGANTEAARYGGIDVKRIVLTAMFLSGGLAGLAGMGEISGLHHYLEEAFSPGYGWTAITVAVLGGLNPWGVLLAAIFFGSLTSGGSYLQVTMKIPVPLVDIIKAVALLLVLCRVLFTKWMR